MKVIIRAMNRKNGSEMVEASIVLPGYNSALDAHDKGDGLLYGNLDDWKLSSQESDFPRKGLTTELLSGPVKRKDGWIL